MRCSITNKCKYNTYHSIVLVMFILTIIKIDQYEISAKIPSHHTVDNSIGFNSKDIFIFDENGSRI